MKKILCSLLVLLFPVIGFTQEAKKEAPKKETINVERVMPKEGHDAALKAAIAAHAQKFHSGSWKWRVSEILTGPDAGGYMIVEGPNSWTDLEGRGDLGAEHMKDYESNVAVHVLKQQPSQYLTYEAEVSTVAAGAYADTKTLISRVTPKPGRGPRAIAALSIWKKIWEKRGSNVVVWRTFYSGVPGYTIAVRLKNGWKDLDEDRIAMRQAADEVGGPGTYDRLMDEMTLNVESVITEMIEYRPELSSK